VTLARGEDDWACQVLLAVDTSQMPEIETSVPLSDIHGGIDFPPQEIEEIDRPA
jgi:hypothetical protein